MLAALAAAFATALATALAAALCRRFHCRSHRPCCLSPLAPAAAIVASFSTAAFYKLIVVFFAAVAVAAATVAMPHVTTPCEELTKNSTQADVLFLLQTPF